VAAGGGAVVGHLRALEGAVARQRQAAQDSLAASTAAVLSWAPASG
jgi:hypothetical protein